MSTKGQGNGEFRLSDPQVAFFNETGFLIVPGIAPVDEVSGLRPVFRKLFERQAGRREGAHYDLVGFDTDNEPFTLPTIINPVNYARELRKLSFRRNAFSIARQLLGDTTTPAFEHSILKPALRGSATPWHQDEAYRVDPNFSYKQVSFWMPLDEATPENGCMQYIPRSNRGPVLRHQSYTNDARVHAIECCDEFDLSSRVVCPIPAGTAIIHDGRTLHYSGPNLSAVDRYAYILAFEVPPRRIKERRDFYWNKGRRTRNQIRRSSWRLKGGIAIEAIRKHRVGILSSPGRALFELQRGFRALLEFLKR